MNYLSLKLLHYEDKQFEEFDIDSQDSIFHVFYKVLLKYEGTRLKDVSLEKNLTDLFNDACAVGTLAKLVKRPYLKLGDFLNAFKSDFEGIPGSGEKRADEVLSLAYFLLKPSAENNDDLQKFLNNIVVYFNDKLFCDKRVFEDFRRYFLSSPLLSANRFIEPRLITEEVLNHLYLQWLLITDNYDIEQIIEYLETCKSRKEWNLVVDSIIKSLSHTQYEGMIDFIEDLRLKEEDNFLPNVDNCSSNNNPEQLNNDIIKENEELKNKIKQLEDEKNEEIEELKMQIHDLQSDIDIKTGKGLTKNQAAVLVYAIAYLTEIDNEFDTPNKDRLVPIVARISGCTETSVDSAIGKWGFPPKDIDSVSKIAEKSSMPKLAAKIKTLPVRPSKTKK